VCRISDFSGSDIDKFSSALLPDEMQRAVRFRFAQDRNRYIVSRAQLRALLGAYLRSHPSSLRFSYSRTGKPELSCTGREPNLRFNVAHSSDVILLAFTWRRRVGVDVERVQFGLASEDIAERFFSASECQALRALPPSQRQQAFFRCWTRKEAYLKATGSGLALPLDSFDVSLAADEPARLLATRLDAQEASRWFMEDLEIEQDYVAALVIEAENLIVESGTE
jgi:4'-phosphopantetheinyl transferase